jgi:ATP-dependent HslUV protease subunit HslV
MNKDTSRPRWRSTTVLLVRRDGKVAMAGDGQVSLGETVMKSGARKVRRLYNERILAGFAGASADAFSLLTRFESKLEQYQGNLERAAIELSKEWRTDKILRHLEALLIVADDKSSFLLSGNGDVIAPDEKDDALDCKSIRPARHAANHFVWKVVLQCPNLFSASYPAPRQSPSSKYS